MANFCLKGLKPLGSYMGLWAFSSIRAASEIIAASKTVQKKHSHKSASIQFNCTM